MKKSSKIPSKKADDKYEGLPAPPGYVRDDPHANDPRSMIEQHGRNEESSNSNDQRSVAGASRGTRGITPEGDKKIDLSMDDGITMKKSSKIPSKKADDKYEGLPAPPGYVRDDPHANDPRSMIEQHDRNEQSSNSNDQRSVAGASRGTGGIAPEGDKKIDLSMNKEGAPRIIRLHLVGQDDDASKAHVNLMKLKSEEKALEESYEKLKNQKLQLSRAIKQFKVALEHKKMLGQSFTTESGKSYLMDMVSTWRKRAANVQELMAKNRQRLDSLSYEKLKIIVISNMKAVAKTLRPLTSEKLQEMTNQDMLEGINTLQVQITKTEEKLITQQAKLDFQEENHNADIETLDKRINFYQNETTKKRNKLRNIQGLTKKSEKVKAQLTIDAEVAKERNKHLKSETLKLKQRSNRLVLMLDSAGVRNGPDQEQLAAELEVLKEHYAAMSTKVKEYQLEILFHRMTSPSARSPPTMLGVPVLIWYVMAIVVAVFAMVIVFSAYRKLK